MTTLNIDTSHLVELGQLCKHAAEEVAKLEQSNAELQDKVSAAEKQAADNSESEKIAAEKAKAVKIVTETVDALIKEGALAADNRDTHIEKLSSADTAADYFAYATRQYIKAANEKPPEPRMARRSGGEPEQTEKSALEKAKDRFDNQVLAAARNR